MEHSKLFSPSQYKLGKNCKASVILSLSLADDSGEEAERGHVMHEVSNKILQMLIRTNLTETRKKKLHLEYLSPLESAEEISMVNTYVENSMEIRKSFLSQVKGKFTEYFEGRLSDAEDSFGTVDHAIVVITPKKKAYILVEDLKTGRIPVEVEKNDQLCRYALMLIAGLPDDVEVASVHLVVHQVKFESTPNIWKTDAKFLDKFREEFLQYKKEIYTILKEGVEEHHFQVNENCDWCPVFKAGVCPEWLKVNEEAIGGSLENLAEQPSIISNVELIPLEKRIRIYKASKHIQKFCEAVTKSLIEEGMKGTDLGDLKVVGTYPRRMWRNDLKVSDMAKELRKLGAKSVTKSSLIGILDVEKMVGINKLDHLTQYTKSNPTLADKSDKREVLIDDALEMLD